MLRYIQKRLLILVFTVLLLSFVFFIIISAIPGSFAQSGIVSGTSIERIERLKEIYGTDESVIKRYAEWVFSAFRGDFGTSFTFKRPVLEVLGEHIGYSFVMAFFALLIELAVALPVGIFSAVKKGKPFDAVFSFLAVSCISMPVFFLGVILKKWFVFDLTWFPSSGFSTAGVELSGIGYLFDVLRHLFLPALTLSVLNIGALIRYTKNSLHEELSKDYIITARAKRLPERVVIVRHGLLNALLPLITYIGSSLPALFSGAIIVESLFSIPGAGKLAYGAAMARDYPLLMGYTMFLVLITLLCNLGTDLLYCAIDPKIRLAKGRGTQ